MRKKWSWLYKNGVEANDRVSLYNLIELPRSIDGEKIILQIGGPTGGRPETHLNGGATETSYLNLRTNNSETRWLFGWEKGSTIHLLKSRLGLAPSQSLTVDKASNYAMTPHTWRVLAIHNNGEVTAFPAVGWEAARKESTIMYNGGGPLYLNLRPSHSTKSKTQIYFEADLTLDSLNNSCWNKIHNIFQLSLTQKSW